ncbi:hypothetical protein V8E54_009322 [Elaphomyces granulatus]
MSDEENKANEKKRQDVMDDFTKLATNHLAGSSHTSIGDDSDGSDGSSDGGSDDGSDEAAMTAAITAATTAVTSGFDEDPIDPAPTNPPIEEISDGFMMLQDDDLQELDLGTAQAATPAAMPVSTGTLSQADSGATTTKRKGRQPGIEEQKDLTERGRHCGRDASFASWWYAVDLREGLSDVSSTIPNLVQLKVPPQTTNHRTTNPKGISLTSETLYWPSPRPHPKPPITTVRCGKHDRWKLSYLATTIYMWLEQGANPNRRLLLTTTAGVKT